LLFHTVFSGKKREDNKQYIQLFLVFLLLSFPYYGGEGPIEREREGERERRRRRESSNSVCLDHHLLSL